ncbi:phage tail tape measure protein [Pseudorhodoplanes sp.]|uniref:phage tail tape measure protein n=1 Tax=Pseudorhodoplanes sp. TaxID=1934341 RepID=UPI00391B6B56
MTRVLEARAVVSATDATGRTFDQIAAKIRRIQAAAKAVSGVAAPIARFSQQAETAGKKLTAVGRGMSVGVTLPAAFAAKRGYDTVLAYEKELNKAQALGQLTSEQAKIVDADAQTLGKTTQFNASQALEMMRTYIQAGRTLDQARGMTRPTLDFALFGDVDPKTAADTITAVASAYRLAMNDLEAAQNSARYVADVIASAANISKAAVGDLAAGFKYAAPMAKIAGVQMEELAGAIATMANNGLRGDEAGVAMRSMLVRMVAPTNKARAAMAELGLEFSHFAEQKPIDAAAMIRSLEQAGIAASNYREQIDKIVSDPKYNGARGEMIPALTEALIKGSDIDTPENRAAIADAVGAYLLSNTSRLDVQRFVQSLIDKQASAGQLARIFDQRQGARIATLLTPDFMKNVETLQREAPGASGRGAAIMDQGLYGAHMRFLSASEGFVLALAKSGVIDGVTDALRSATNAINALGEASPDALRIATYAAAAAAALGPLAYVLGKLAGGAALLAKGLGLGVAGTAGYSAAVAAGTAGAGVGAAASALPMYGLYRDLTDQVAGGPINRVAADPTAMAAAMQRAGLAKATQDFAPLKAGSLKADLKPLTIDAVQSALGAANITAQLEGNANIGVNVKVEPSPDFMTRIQTMISNAINNVRLNNGAPATGTSGSTGRTMPETGAAP